MIFRLDGVQLHFQDRRRLKLPALEVKRGESLALIGGNGTGKSSLLRVLAKLDVPAAGVVDVDPAATLTLIPTELRLFLFPWYSAAQNLALFASAGRSCELRNREHFAEEWAFLLQRESCVALMDREVHRLSSGERSSLGLMCAMLRPFDVLLLDELFANASRATTTAMVATLKKQVDGGRTLVFASHSESVVSDLASRALDLEDFIEES